jgi:hypothetical protein
MSTEVETVLRRDDAMYASANSTPLPPAIAADAPPRPVVTHQEPPRLVTQQESPAPAADPDSPAFEMVDEFGEMLRWDDPADAPAAGAEFKRTLAQLEKNAPNRVADWLQDNAGFIADLAKHGVNVMGES